MVSGLLESPEDEKIVDFLKKYGSMRLVPVTDIKAVCPPKRFFQLLAYFFNCFQWECH
ncbi:hypothetical protein ABG768_021791, partial [Culter alburnus]